MKKTAWTPEFHRRTYPNNFNNGLCKYIAETYGPNNVLEFGCGLGWYCKYFSDNCKGNVYGIEPNLMDFRNFENANAEQLCLDLTVEELPNNLFNFDLDLFLSIEVMEHIHLKYHSRLFDMFVAQKPKIVIFSAARVGQGGHGHIAERNEEQWRKEWTSRGYIFSEEKTQSLRKNSNKTNINHIKNLQFFERGLL